MKAVVLSASFALAMLFSATEASADVLWSSVAAGCVPIDDSIQNDVYSSGSAGPAVGFKTGVTGDIELVCPIFFSTTHGNPAAAFATFRDADGTATAAQVTVKLYRMAWDGTGFIQTLATIDSNTSATTTTHQMFDAFSSTFDFDLSMYWMGIKISRTNSALTTNTLLVGLTDVCVKCD